MARSIPRSGLWLLACAAVCAAIAIVRLEPAPPQVGDLDGSTASTALPGNVASALERLHSQDGLEWRVISRIETPWGPDIRFRPYHGPVEIRGIDVRLISGGRLLFEQPRHDGDRLRREAERLEGMIEVGSARWHGSSSAYGGQLGQDSPWTTSPSAVLLVSGDEIVPAYQAVLSAPAALRGSAGVGTTADLLEATVGTAEFHSEIPLPQDAPLPVLVVLDRETGRAREVHDLRRAAEGEAHVFDPNPIATSGLPNLRDGDPVEDYRVWVPVSRLEAGGALRGKWVRVGSDLGPEANESNHVYDYVSTDPRFEQAMAYVHGDRSFQHAEELGFLGLLSEPIGIVVHGTRLDNSWYSPPTREIIFGSGGVDDAEDGDIILHETGHAIHDALVPGFGGGDTRAISEGFADYWAASLTDDACVGDWDATSYGPPCLRRVDDDVVYPASLTGSVHKDGRLWSSLLWDLRAELGPELGDRLALAALREQSWDSSWEDAAQALLRAADRLGLPRSSVEPQLARHGFLAEILSVDLGAGQTERIELPNSASFLGHTALALDVSGDGNLRFVDTRNPDPSSSPWFAPYAPEETGDLTLRARGEMEGAVLAIDFSWLGPGEAVLLRSRTEWDTESGHVSWCLVDVNLGSAHARSVPLRFFSGCGLGSEELQAIDWESGNQTAWLGLTGFQGTHPGELGTRIGERWELEDNGTGVFNLRRNSYGRTLENESQLFAQPSPFRSRTEIRFYAPSSEVVEVTVHSADGRILRRLARERTERGLRIWDWDGLGDRGQELASGRYWIRARGAQTNEIVSVVKIR